MVCGGCCVAPFRNFHQNGVLSRGISAVNRQNILLSVFGSTFCDVISVMASGRKIRWNQVVAVQARTCWFGVWSLRARPQPSDLFLKACESWYINTVIYFLGITLILFRIKKICFGGWTLPSSSGKPTHLVPIDTGNPCLRTWTELFLLNK